MPFRLEENAWWPIQLIAEHRPRNLATFMDTVPGWWWATAAQRALKIDELKEAGSDVLARYHAATYSMTFSHDWFGDKLWSWPDMLRSFEGRSTEILEIGVFEGRSVVFCLEALPEAKVTAIDHFVTKAGWTSSQGVTLTEDTEIVFRRNVERYGDRVEVMVSSSWSALSSLIYDRREFDVIYVDAAHTSVDVLADTLLAWRLLKPGGLFIWDDFLLDIWDIGPRTTTQGICQFLKMFEGSYEWVHAGQQVAVRKLVEVAPSYIGV